MKTENIISLVIGAILVLTGALFVSVHPSGTSGTQVLGGSNGGPTGIGGATRFITIPSNTSVVCGPTPASTLVQATSTSRVYLTMVNDGGSAIYLTEGVAAAASIGIRINSTGGSYEMNALNMFIGAVYCNAAASSTLTIISNQ